ncbi:MAG: methyltransferase [Hyphomicrobiales bacterium]
MQSAGEGPPRPVPAPPEPPLQKMRRLLSAFQQTAVLSAAYSLGIFSEIHRRPLVAADIARHCASDPRGVELLLEALVALGVVHKHGASYVLPREMAPYLVPGEGGDATGLIEGIPDAYHAWGDLERGVREGTPRDPLGSDALLTGDPGRVRRYIRSVHTGSREAAHRIVELAPIPPGSSFLDLGGGSGVYAAEYARRTPGVTAHLFDLPPTLEVAREILLDEGYEENVTFHPGDYRTDPFPGPVDTILISNLLQTESEEHALGILRKAWEAIRPGGTLLVHGMMSDEEAPPSAPLALFSLLMFLVFEHGRAWSVQRIHGWLAQERFGIRATRELGPPFHSRLILATRLE